MLAEASFLLTVIMAMNNVQFMSARKVDFAKELKKIKADLPVWG